MIGGEDNHLGFDVSDSGVLLEESYFVSGVAELAHGVEGLVG